MRKAFSRLMHIKTTCIKKIAINIVCERSKVNDEICALNNIANKFQFHFNFRMLLFRWWNRAPLNFAFLMAFMTMAIFHCSQKNTFSLFFRLDTLGVTSKLIFNEQNSHINFIICIFAEANPFPCVLFPTYVCMQF